MLKTNLFLERLRKLIFKKYILVIYLLVAFVDLSRAGKT